MRENLIGQSVDGIDFVRHLEKKNYIEVRCTKCAADPELNGSAIYKIQTGAWKRGVKPCECCLRPRSRSQETWNVLLRRCEARTGTKIITVEPVISNAARLTFICKAGVHEISCKCSEYLSGKADGCDQCRVASIITKRSSIDIKVKEILDTKGYQFVEWISETARGGARHPSTFRFVCDKGHHRTAKYNDVIDHPEWCCGHCRLQIWKEEHDRKAVMYLTEWQNQYGKKFLKLGITGKTAKERIDQQADWTDYTPTILRTVEFDSAMACHDAETDIKRNLRAAGALCVVTKEEFGDGYTETCSTDHRDELDDLLNMLDKTVSN